MDGWFGVPLKMGSTCTSSGIKLPWLFLCVAWHTLLSSAFSFANSSVGHMMFLQYQAPREHSDEKIASSVTLGKLLDLFVPPLLCL